MKQVRRAIAGVCAAGIVAIGLVGCAAQPPPTEWVGQGAAATSSIGALPDVLHLEWTDDNGKLQGQFEITEQNTDAAGPPTNTFNATLTGIESEGKVTINVSGTNQNRPWRGSATGTIDETKLVLNGDALIGYDAYSLNGVTTGTVAFKPGSAKTVNAAIAKLYSSAKAARHP